MEHLIFIAMLGGLSVGLVGIGKLLDYFVLLEKRRSFYNKLQNLHTVLTQNPMDHWKLVVIRKTIGFFDWIIEFINDLLMKKYNITFIVTGIALFAVISEVGTGTFTIAVIGTVVATVTGIVAGTVTPTVKGIAIGAFAFTYTVFVTSIVAFSFTDAFAELIILIYYVLNYVSGFCIAKFNSKKVIKFLAISFLLSINFSFIALALANFIGNENLNTFWFSAFDNRIFPSNIASIAFPVNFLFDLTTIYFTYWVLTKVLNKKWGIWPAVGFDISLSFLLSVVLYWVLKAIECYFTGRIWSFEFEQDKDMHLLPLILTTFIPVAVYMGILGIMAVIHFGLNLSTWFIQASLEFNKPEEKGFCSYFTGFFALVIDAVSAGCKYAPMAWSKGITWLSSIVS